MEKRYEGTYNKLVEFKSIPEYYHLEVEDKKNNTIREIDWDDERFAILNLMKTNNDYGFIKITMTERIQGENVSFIRMIKNVCIWRDLMIITWKEQYDKT